MAQALLAGADVLKCMALLAAADVLKCVYT